MAKQENKNAGKGKTPHELMHKHVVDKEDVISDEDFKNMAIGATVDLNIHEVHLPENISADENKDPGNVTPWDVLKK